MVKVWKGIKKEITLYSTMQRSSLYVFWQMFSRLYTHTFKHVNTWVHARTHAHTNTSCLSSWLPFCPLSSHLSDLGWSSLMIPKVDTWPNQSWWELKDSFAMDLKMRDGGFGARSGDVPAVMQPQWGLLSGCAAEQSRVRPSALHTHIHRSYQNHPPPGLE